MFGLLWPKISPRDENCHMLHRIIVTIAIKNHRQVLLESIKDNHVCLGSLPVSYFSTNLIRKPPLLAETRARVRAAPVVANLVGFGFYY